MGEEVSSQLVVYDGGLTILLKMSMRQEPDAEAGAWCWGRDADQTVYTPFPQKQGLSRDCLPQWKTYSQ